ncbi:MAG: MFS transporter, partial [Candidatus Hodarchaeota archaeon]
TMTGTSTKAPRELKGFGLMGYSIGIAGQFLPNSFLSTFVVQYYVYTVSLNALLAGIATFVALVVYALSSVFFGVITDNQKPGKLGKRRPYLLLSMVFMIPSIILIWTPPMCTGKFEMNPLTFIYLLVLFSLYNLGFGILRPAYTSMMPEQSETEENRVKIGAIQGVVSLVGTVFAILIPIIIAGLVPEPDDVFYWTVGGMTYTTVVPIIGLVLASVSVLCTSLAFFATNEDHLKERYVEKEKKSVKENLGRIFEPFKDKKFQPWLGSTLIFNISMKMLMLGLYPFLYYVLKLEKTDLYISLGVLIPVAGAGFVIWKRKSTKSSPLEAYRLAISILSIALSIMVVFFFNLTLVAKIVIGLILMGIGISCLVTGYIFPNPIISSLIEEEMICRKEKSSEDCTNISGIYFGSYLFTLSISYAVGNFVLGSLFTGKNAENPTIITLLFPLAAIAFFVSYLVMRKVKIQKAK